MSERVYVFSCGSQYMDWTASNCERCDKANDEPGHPYDCDMQEALDLGCFGDGTVSEDVAQRMGRTDYGQYYNWPCPAKRPEWDIAGWLERKKAGEA